MPQHDERHVVVNDGIIVWEGINSPNPPKEPGGKQQWNLKCVFPPGHPDIALLDQLAAKCLNESPFNGVLPNGGIMPVSIASPTDFGGMFPGWHVVSFKTSRGVPDILDENAQPIPAQMTWGPMMYTGQKVNLLAHCYHFNNKSRGVAAGLDAVQIVVSAQSPRLQLAGPSVDATAAFGGAPAQGQPAQQQQPYQQPAQGQPPQQQQPYQQQPYQQPAQGQPAQQQQPYQQQPYQQPAQGQPAQQQQPYQQPAQGQPAQQQQPYQQPAQGQPAQQQQPYQQPAQQQYPQQATDFLPQQ